MNEILKVLKSIEKYADGLKIPSVTAVSLRNDPYLVLISCILSLRTKDKTTVVACRKLFTLADNPRKMVRLKVQRLEKLIYPVGFYRNKSRVILGLSKRIINDFSGQVPDNLEGLLSLKGVGRKTANLVLGLGFGIPAICVDTHVHRISNRLGWVKTRSVEETEQALEAIIFKEYWIKLNTVLVAFGQNICLPVSPYCSKCVVRSYCKKKGVLRWR